jgi:hypothetical protein
METLAERQPEPENPKVQQPRLTAADVGIFNPTAMPDHLPAMQFIDDFTDAVAYYGEDATRQVLRRCCAGPIARTWLTSLDDVDRQALRSSTRDWERLIRRDFMPPKDIMEGIARAEKYDWTQARTPAEYFTHKLALLRIAGIVDQDRVVREVHRGFTGAPQLQFSINQYAVKKSGRSVSEYRSAMQNYQDAARLLYEEVFGVFGELGTHNQPRRRADGLCGVTTPKPGECRACHIAFPSRSQLHQHLRASGHTERRYRTNRAQPDSEIIRTGCTTNQAIRKRYREAFGHEPTGFTGTNVQSTAPSLEPEETTSSHSNRRQPRHAFFGIARASTASETPATTPLELNETAPSLEAALADETYIPTPPGPDRFDDNTGYEGVTIKERGYPPSPVSDRARLRSSFTTVPAAFPLSLRFSSMLRETSTARRLQRLRVRRKLLHWQARPGKLKRRRGK